MTRSNDHANRIPDWKRKPTSSSSRGSGLRRIQEKMGEDPEIVHKIIDGKGVVTTSSPIFAAFVNDLIANSQAE